MPDFTSSARSALPPRELLLLLRERERRDDGYKSKSPHPHSHPLPVYWWLHPRKTNCGTSLQCTPRAVMLLFEASPLLNVDTGKSTTNLKECQQNKVDAAAGRVSLVTPFGLCRQQNHVRFVSKRNGTSTQKERNFLHSNSAPRAGIKYTMQCTTFAPFPWKSLRPTPCSSTFPA